MVHRGTRTDPGGRKGAVGGWEISDESKDDFRSVQVWAKVKVCGFVTM